MPFPPDFLWGASISGFQFEMGGRRENWDTNSDWWVWVHDRENIRKRVVSGDLPENGVNYWELYRRDHQLAEELGLNAFRLSTEWSRIFPHSTEKVQVETKREGELLSKITVNRAALEELDGLANQRAVEHYREIIVDLKKRGIRVFLCLNHFTLPLWIHDPITARDSRLSKGPRGWLDERTVVEFTKYAAYMAWKFGDLVDYWSTFNEPIGIVFSYLFPTGFPPNVLKLAPRLSRFPLAKVALNMVMAHARAHDAIKEWDRKRAERGSPSPAEVGLIYNIVPTYPLREGNPFDEKAAKFNDYLMIHWFLQAVSLGLLDVGFNPENRKRETHLAGKLDWLGVNYYSRNVVRGWVFPFLKQLFGIPAFPQPVPGYGSLGGVRSIPLRNPGQVTQVEERSLAGFPVAEDFGWEIFPLGLKRAVEEARKYCKIVYITENGVSDSTDRLRPQFLIDHLRVVEEMLEGGIEVGGYFHWSLLDNYEWARGFRNKFGLCAVDLKTKQRRPRPSFQLLQKIIRSGGCPQSPRSDF
ncbi:MAG: beta-galactosidase BgaS [Candidatus Hadarchaeales archaeon]